VRPLMLWPRCSRSKLQGRGQPPDEGCTWNLPRKHVRRNPLRAVDGPRRLRPVVPHRCVSRALLVTVLCHGYPSHQLQHSLTAGY
jgi:hypothetical protein